MPLWPILAATGAAKAELIDKPKADRQRQRAAVQTMYSPWTGLQPEKVEEADTLGSALQWGLAGAMMGGGEAAAAEGAAAEGAGAATAAKTAQATSLHNKLLAAAAANQSMPNK